MTVRDVTIPGHRRLSDKTLSSMKKSELIVRTKIFVRGEKGKKNDRQNNIL